MPHKTQTLHQPSHTTGRIRAFRQHDVETQIEHSRLLLGLGNDGAGLDARRPQRLARALRLARRAARGGLQDYDPVRHLVLARYLRSLSAPGSNGCGDARKSGKQAREDV